MPHAHAHEAAIEAVFSEALLSFRVKDGKAEVRKGNFESETLSAEVDGYITLSDKPGFGVELVDDLE